MSNLRSHAHIHIILNGHRFSGWADDDPPYEFETEEAAEFKRGQDGGLYGRSMQSFGATLTFKLDPSSLTTQWCIQQEQLRKNSEKDGGVIRGYEGSISDSSAAISMRLAGGSILKLPPWSVANMSYEGQLIFEEVTSEVDGGRFHPPLTSDAAGFNFRF